MNNLTSGTAVHLHTEQHHWCVVCNPRTVILCMDSYIDSKHFLFSNSLLQYDNEVMEGNLFSHVCLSGFGGGHIQGPSPSPSHPYPKGIPSSPPPAYRNLLRHLQTCSTWTSPYRDMVKLVHYVCLQESGWHCFHLFCTGKTQCAHEFYTIYNIIFFIQITN